ncbi:MAG TPA: CoA-binding protein [Steroidobacteraceae bacterium]|jgi:predicted CoA-binding protein|nr:CoA-binding protein [Steroidobacteraceae bacterium]
MPFHNPTPQRIRQLLTEARTVAIVGLSDNPQRPSYEVACVLRDYGYRIIPVNPRLAVWEGIRAVPDLEQATKLMGPGERIDIVDVFRKPEEVGVVVDECIRLKLPAVWLQLGCVDEAAAQRGTDAGLTVVMDRCMKIERMNLD